MSTHSTLMIGLPESGKTTFIAALWHVVESDEVASALRVNGLIGDRASLNKLRTTWLRCEKIGRTSQQGESTIRMVLADRESATESELLLPDMSGESFRDQWEFRTWSKNYDELVNSANGALLFVHPNKIAEPIRIDAVTELSKTIDGASAAKTQDPNEADANHPAMGVLPLSPDAPPKPALWDPKKAPSQVQLVDLLQFILWRRTQPTFRIAVIVSAWDLVRTEQLAPDRWCDSRLPLLSQFLASNSDILHTEYYGVSAQGGVLPHDAERLRDLTHASQRIEVVARDGSCSHDITLPLQRLNRGTA